MTVADVAADLEEDQPGADGRGEVVDEDLELELPEVDPGRSTIWDHLTACPDRSVTEVDHRDLFSPEDGGFDRFALVVEDCLQSDGVPNWVHLVVGAIEVALGEVRDRDGRADQGDLEVVDP